MQLWPLLVFPLQQTAGAQNVQMWPLLVLPLQQAAGAQNVQMWPLLVLPLQQAAGAQNVQMWPLLVSSLQQTAGTQQLMCNRGLSWFRPYNNMRSRTRYSGDTHDSPSVYISGATGADLSPKHKQTSRSQFKTQLIIKCMNSKHNQVKIVNSKHNILIKTKIFLNQPIFTFQ